MNVGHIRSKSLERANPSLTSPRSKGHGERTCMKCHLAHVGEGICGRMPSFRVHPPSRKGSKQKRSLRILSDAVISLVITSTKCWNFVFHSLLFKTSSPKFTKHLMMQYWPQVPHSFQAEVLDFYFWDVQSLCSSNPFTLKINNHLLFKLEQ